MNNTAKVMAYRIQMGAQNGYMPGDTIAWLDYNGCTQISTITEEDIRVLRSTLEVSPPQDAA